MANAVDPEDAKRGVPVVRKTGELNEDERIVKAFAESKIASVDNLWCWTKYTGVDPDVSPQGFAVSTDNNRTPRTKSFTCSLTLGF
jgi:hypothetical protein